MDTRELFRILVKEKGSDLIIKANGWPAMRIQGKIKFVSESKVPDAFAQTMAEEVIPDKLKPRFERDGEDLYCEVLVSYPQLVLGADVEVPTIGGAMTMRLSPGAQSGQVIHLRGRGLPRVNGSGTGDLHVRVQLWTPPADSLSAEEKELIRKLGTLSGQPPQEGRPKGFWTKMKEALGA